MIWYLQPYSISRNIGAEYNRQIALLPDDAIICILDHDFCFLLPDTKKQIEEIAIKGEYDLYGCMTNRVSLPHQLHGGKISDDADIRNHTRIAQQIQDELYGICEPTNYYIAGFFMLFRKSVWHKVGGFVEKSYSFDRVFSGQVKNKAIMQGVYGFHCYRLLSNNPTKESRHLIYKK